MPGQNANTLYCGCWLFQYNKGRRKIYVFFPKEANFCEHCMPLSNGAFASRSLSWYNPGDVPREWERFAFGVAAVVSREAILSLALFSQNTLFSQNVTLSTGKTSQIWSNHAPWRQNIVMQWTKYKIVLHYIVYPLYTLAIRRIAPRVFVMTSHPYRAA